MNDQVWLRCKVYRGIFSDEVVIEIEVPGSGVITGFVPKDSVRVEEGTEEGQVQVDVYTLEDGKWAVLPTTGRDAIPVQESDFVAA